MWITSWHLGYYCSSNCFRSPRVWAHCRLACNQNFQQFSLVSGITRGGGGGRVTHPWKVWGEILEGRGKGRKREGRGKMRGKEKREGKGKWKMERKRREIVKGEEENWKWEGKGMKMDREPFLFFLFCLSLFETTEICLVYQNGNLLWGGGGISNLANLWLHTWLRPCV